MIRQPPNGDAYLSTMVGTLNAELSRKEPLIIGASYVGANLVIRYRAPYGVGWIQAQVQSSVTGGMTYSPSTYVSSTLVDCRADRMQTLTVTMTAGVQYAVFLVPVQYDGAGTQVKYDGQSGRADAMASWTTVTGTSHTHDASTLTGTTLASNVVTSSLTALGTVTTGVWNAGAVTSSGGISGTTGNFGAATVSGTTVLGVRRASGATQLQVALDNLTTARDVIYSAVADGTEATGHVFRARSAGTTTDATVLSINTTAVTSTVPFSATTGTFTASGDALVVGTGSVTADVKAVVNTAAATYNAMYQLRRNNVLAAELVAHANGNTYFDYQGSLIFRDVAGYGSQFTLTSAGALTLGSVAGTGTGALYAGAISGTTGTFSGTLKLNSTTSTVRLYYTGAGAGAGLPIYWSGDVGGTDQSLGAVAVVQEDGTNRRGKMYLQVARDAAPAIAVTINSNLSAEFAAGLSATTGTFSGVLLLNGATSYGASMTARGSAYFQNTSGDAVLLYPPNRGVASYLGAPTGSPVVVSAGEGIALALGVGTLGAANLYLSTNNTARLTIDGTTGAATFASSISATTGHIGDAATNYCNIATDGEITLVGTARVKKEIYIPVARLTLGASAPTAANRAVGASGSIKVPVLQFSKTTAQETYFEVHLPSDCDGSVNVAFHLMWFPGASWTTGNFMWKLDYLVKNETGVALNTGTPTTIYADVTPSAATDVIQTTTFSATIDAGPDQTIWCRLWRDVANDNGDDVGEVRFAEIEYTANKLGEAT